MVVTVVDDPLGGGAGRVRVEAPDGRPLAALAALREAQAHVDEAKRRAVVAARNDGASWSEIGDALGVSRQSAWQLYSQDLRAMLDRAAERSGLSEDDAMTLAIQEIEAARRERRSRRAS